MNLLETVTWVPVAERTPNFDELVLGWRVEWLDGVQEVWVDGAGWYGAGWCHSSGHRYFASAEDTNELPPTHWAPRLKGPQASGEAETGPITVAEIQRAVAKQFNVPLTAFTTGRRDQPTVFNRQVAMYLCREFTGLSLAAIGAEFGRRDHGTVLHAWRAVNRTLREGTAVATCRLIDDLLEHFQGRKEKL